MSLWSYVSATYIIGRMTTCPLMATGRGKMPCMPRIADCGGLMMGVDMREPKTPPLVIEKVPPTMSSTVRLPSLALVPILTVEDMVGGTFSITNGGVFG